MGRRDVHQADPPQAISGVEDRSILAQGGESWLIFRAEGIVCIGKHKSKVRTIEQILFKYSHISASTTRTYTPPPTSFHKAYGAELHSSLWSFKE